MPFERVPNHLRTLRRKPDWGDVYWFDFGGAVSGQRSFAGVHPALIIAEAKRILPGTTEVIPLTGMENRRKGYDFHVPILKTHCSFLDKDSIAKVDQVYCVLNSDLPDQYYIGTIPLQIMRPVYAQLLRVLGADRFHGR